MSSASSKAILVPSGDQSGRSPMAFSVVASVVSWLRFDPSAFITQMCEFAPPRVLLNAILLPSGDQAGLVSEEPEVSCFGSEPSAFMTQIWSPGKVSATYAIFVPSGDHAGSMASTPGVRFVALLPSGWIVQIVGNPFVV